MTNKPIKWGFKFWYCCASKTRYLYQFDLCLAKQKSREENLRPSVVLALTECLEERNCTIYFDNFFNSLSLIIKLFDKVLYGIGTARMDRKGMPEIKPEKQMKKNDRISVYWQNCLLQMIWWTISHTLLSNISVMQLTSTVQRRMKGSATKIPGPCPDVIKMCNQSMGCIELVTKEQQFTIFIVNLQFDFIYVLFSIWCM